MPRAERETAVHQWDRLRGPDDGVAYGALACKEHDEAVNAERPDSLLSDIARTQPRLRNRVRGVRTQYRQLRETMESLRRELQHDDPSLVDFADFRQRLSWVMTALRHQRARESDLIYEAYYEAFRADLRPTADDPPDCAE